MDKASKLLITNIPREREGTMAEKYKKLNIFPKMFYKKNKKHQLWLIVVVYAYICSLKA